MVVNVTVVVLHFLHLLLFVRITIVIHYILYVDDPLWDGQNCNGPESTCCTNPNIPWFLKTLNETATDNIELRVCSDQGLPNEDTPLDIIRNAC